MISLTRQDENAIRLQLGGDNSLLVGLNPFRIDFLHKNNIVMGASNQGLFNFEHHREKREADLPGMWDESFKTHADTKPLGPSSGKPHCFFLMNILIAFCPP